MDNIVEIINKPAVEAESIKEAKEIDEVKVEEVKVVKKRYTQAQKDAQRRYRDKYPERYCKQQRDLYDKLKSNEEWKGKFNERCRKNNALQRDRKKLELMADPNYVPPKRGRPRNN